MLEKLSFSIILLISFIYAFVVGIFSKTLIFFFISLVFFEIVFYYYSAYYDISQRCALLYAYLAGWILVRTMFSERVLPDWVP
jgi:hypothetical protein